MKKQIKLIIVSLLSFFNVVVIAQTTQPKLGYALSPEGFPADYSQMAPFLTEVAGMCDGGSVLINGEWRTTIASSGNIPSLHNTLESLSVYPNPSTGRVNFTFDASDPPEKLIVADALGRIVIVREIKLNEYNIQINLSSGIYFYRIIADRKINSGKIIIN